MRREMVEDSRRYPERSKGLRLLRLSIHMVAMKWFRYRLQKLRLGSQEWHKMQERLSHGSSVGREMQKRNEFYMRTLSKCGEGLCVFPGSIIYFPRNVELRNDIFINRNVYIVAPAPVVIGSNVLIGPSVIINSGSHQYSDASRLVRRQGHKELPILIEDDVWIGANAVILPGVTLRHGAVVAAGAVVTRSVDAFDVVAGIPARVVRRRTHQEAEGAPIMRTL